MKEKLGYDTLDLLTVKEVALKFKCSVQTVGNLIREDKLPAIKFGRLYKIRKEDLEEYTRSRYLRATKKAGKASGSIQ